MPAPKKNVKRQPIDLDTLAAEAAEEPHVVTFGGQEFVIPALEDWPVESVDALNTGQVTAALQVVMGDEQWEQFQTHKPTLRAVRLMVEAVTEQAGVGGSGN